MFPPYVIYYICITRAPSKSYHVRKKAPFCILFHRCHQMFVNINLFKWHIYTLYHMFCKANLCGYQVNNIYELLIFHIRNKKNNKINIFQSKHKIPFTKKTYQFSPLNSTNEDKIFSNYIRYLCHKAIFNVWNQVGLTTSWPDSNLCCCTIFQVYKALTLLSYNL